MLSLTPRERRLAVLLAGLTVLSRLALVLMLRTWTGDAGAYEHGDIARTIMSGGGFRWHFFSDVPIATGHQAPAIPWVLAAAFALFGVDAPAARLAVEALGALAAALPALAIGLLARRWWGGRAMWIAMAGFLLYPAFIYLPTRIQSVTWSITFLLPMVASFVLLSERPASWRLGAATGVIGGLGLLGEPILAASLGLCWLWLCHRVFWRVDGRPRRWGGAIAVALAATLVIAPWTVRNAVALGSPSFVKSSFWYVFWEGNHPGASGTDKRPLPPELRRQLAWSAGVGPDTEARLDEARAQYVSVDEDLTPGEVAEITALPTERAKMGWFRTRALEELRADPGAYVALSLRRLRMLVWFDDTNPRSFVLVYRLPYLLLLGLALAGGVRMARARALPDGFGFWVSALAGLLIVHTLVITSARFRIVIESLYVLPAAYGAARLFQALSRSARLRSSPRSPGPQ